MGKRQAIQGVLFAMTVAAVVVATGVGPVQSQVVEYCNYRAAYQCPSCFDTPPNWSIRNATAVLPIYLCAKVGTKSCATGTSIACTGDLYDAPCGFAGNFLGGNHGFGADSCILP